MTTTSPDMATTLHEGLATALRGELIMPEIPATTRPAPSTTP